MKLSVNDAAKELNISKEAIYNRIRRGSLKSVKENNKTYVILDEQVQKDNTQLINSDLINQINQLKLVHIELRNEIELLKNQLNTPVITKAKWLLLNEYLLKFKENKRDKIRKFLLSQIGKNKKIKIENSQIFIKNKKLSKIKDN
ncbi:helix-turn-helix domain-containing protein [Campylobacter canadensis]|uniref:Helix-turn-helix domain-containing protein n=1 Tax=Campylobacter canadensis TaxID=449520 RepID=A0ABS7WUG1_9BACT|nr:helix-turn-helix domain-containing protein [Campylobacter canadensis]MBZ7987664.1 helix-turn-helix domain-containing protein [Campylobacter canadensis]MBZ7995013.1 helix-turn-helix domain-containing protein [Campylobacter canadensis]MBZ7996955.1 helix-turn-helix domain-containing protein [Campylobacter canadensis]MBZ7998799.1 helix-turn-helix domain-containing protein [Campylobacter canadensis]MBZ8000434.1 helix-turn-helix domain-containing protein [Campylobacter canadensis]